MRAGQLSQPPILPRRAPACCVWFRRRWSACFREGWSGCC